MKNLSLTNWSRPATYLRLDIDRVQVKDIATGRTVQEEPLVAVAAGHPRRCLGVGRAAKNCALKVGVNLINPFSNPRSLIAHTTFAETLLCGLFIKLYPGRLFMPAPRVLVHPVRVPDDGFAPIEIRALEQTAVNAGASSVSVWVGRSLTDDELKRYCFGKQRSTSSRPPP